MSLTLDAFLRQHWIEPVVFNKQRRELWNKASRTSANLEFVRGWREERIYCAFHLSPLIFLSLFFSPARCLHGLIDPWKTQELTARNNYRQRKKIIIMDTSKHYSRFMFLLNLPSISTLQIYRLFCITPLLPPWFTEPCAVFPLVDGLTPTPLFSVLSGHPGV